MLIDAARQTFDMREIDNRRFMYDPDTCKLILGPQYSSQNIMTGSHATEHGKSGATEPFDSFSVRGWIGTGRSYKYGIIHFAPHIDCKNADRFTNGYNTLQMFRENGAAANTVVRGFGKDWEQPLSNILPGFMEENKEKESEGLTMAINAIEETYEPVELFHKPALFTNARIDRDTIPAGFFACDLREGDDGRAATAEMTVKVNHMGTVILAEPLDYGDDEYIPLTEENGGLNFTSEHDCTALSQYGEYIQSKRAETQCYGVWAVRSAASVFGHYEAWSKHNDVPIVFLSQEAAQQQAARYKKIAGNIAKVHYYAKEMEPETALSALATLKGRMKAMEAPEVVYLHTAAYAREHGELSIFRQSNRLNRECAQAIDAAITANWNGSSLNPEGMKAVIEKYGERRVNIVLANTVCDMEHDGRFSRDNKEWAKGFPRLESNGFALSSHPVKLDSFISQIRAGILERNTGERPSALEKLDAAKKAVKPPAPAGGKSKDKGLE